MAVFPKTGRHHHLSLQVTATRSQDHPRLVVGVVGSMGLGFIAGLLGLPPEGPHRDPHCHCTYP